VPVTVTSIDVLDQIVDRTVETLAGDELTAATSLLASPTEPTATLPPSSIGVVWFDVVLANPDEIPATVEHRMTVKIPPGLPVPETVTYTTGAIAVDLRPPVVLGPPLRGPGWAAVGSCCDGPHRRAFQPLNGGLYLSQRFAIDFNLLDAEGRIVVGDPSRNESYPTFGQTAIAVADATVVAARDGLPDQVPNDPKDVTLETADGNYVVLDLGDGRYAFYAHLKSGSVGVQAGDVVRRGQRIGDVGNSGSSTGAHLHFHVMDGPSALEADGLPYVFDAFELAGQMPPLEEIMGPAEAGQPVPIDPTRAGPRRDALPLGRDVVAFPEESGS
jgi:Peptidase family M23